MKLAITITTDVSPDLARVVIGEDGRRQLLDWLIETCATDLPGTKIKFTTSRTVELGERTLFDLADDADEAVEQEQVAELAQIDAD